MSIHPTVLADFSASWLTSILNDAGFHSIQVRSVRPDTIGGKQRFNAAVYRLHLEYDQAQPDLPSSLIAKLPAGLTELDDRAHVLLPGYRESWFYRSVGAQHGIAVPRCYYNRVDPQSDQSVLLLEDIHPAHSASWLKGTSTTVARMALDSAARLHARWWQRGDSPEIAELLQALSESALGEQKLVQDLYVAAWPRFLARFRKEIPPEVRHFGDALLGNMAAVDRLLDGSPKTLIHGDFRVDNLLFTVRQGVYTCWLIDWEDTSFRSGLLDIAWLLGGCLQDRDRKEEANLLEYYFLALINAGVQGYSWEQCLDDYTRAMCSCFVQGVLSAAKGLDRRAGEAKLSQVLARRWIHAARRLQLHDLIGAY